VTACPALRSRILTGIPLTLAVTVLTFVSIISTEAGVAEARPAVAAGDLFCNLQGTVTFRPALGTVTSIPVVAKLKGIVFGCSSSIIRPAPTPFGITGGAITGSFPLETDNCSYGNHSHNGQFRIRWVGTTKVVSSVFSSDSNTFSYNGFSTGSTANRKGSFRFNEPFMSEGFANSGVGFTDCMSSQGFKTATFNQWGGAIEV
jgi:hypothetical protein